MRPTHAVTLALVLAIGIAALAFFLRSDSDPAPTAPGDPRTAQAPAATGGTAPTGELVRPEGSTEPQPTRSTGIEAAHATTPETAAAANATGLRGRVVDGRGRPVMGARVSADLGELDGAFEIDVPGEDAFPGSVDVVTDKDGRFALLPKGKTQTRLSVRAGGFAPFDRTEPVSKAGRDLGDLVLEDSAILTGRVIDPNGRGVPDAKIKRLRPDPGGEGGLVFFGGSFGGIEVATTDAQGRFRVDQLAAGPWKLRVESDDHPDKVFTGSTDHPGANVSGLELALDEGTTIDGTIVGAPPELLPKLWVRAQPRPSAEGGGEIVEAGFFFGAARKARVNADGSFRIRGLKPGSSYRLVARDSEREFGAGRTCTAPQTVAAGERGARLPYRAETAVVFQVVDSASGAPLETLDVSGGNGFTMPMVDEKGQLQRKFPGGRVRFVRRTEGPGLGGGDGFQLEVAARGYKPYERTGLTLLDGQDNDLGVVRMERAPLVHVRVRDAKSNAPLANARVELVEKPLENSDERRIERRVSIAAGAAIGEEDVDTLDPSSGRTDKDGLASLTSMPGKRVEVRVTHKERAPWSSGAFVLPEEGDHDVEAALTAGGTVIVEVVDGEGHPVPGIELDRRGPGAEGGGMPMFGGTRHERSDAQGRATFEHLAAGKQRFRIAESSARMFSTGEGSAISFDMGDRGGGQEWSEVDVVEGETATLRLVAPERAKLVGRITEGGRPLTGARVELVEEGDGGIRMPFMGSGPNDQSDSGGEYAIERVTLGRYTLRVSHSLRAMDWEAPLEIHSGENTFHVDLPVAILEGRVSGPDGKPIAGARVRAERASSDEPGRERAQFIAVAMTDDAGDGPMVSFGGSGAGPTVTTDAEGRYKLRGVLPDVDLVVKAQAKDVQPGQSEKVRVAADQTKGNVDVKLETGGGIEITFVRADGRPANSCMVIATFEEGGAEPRNEFSGPKSSVKLTGLKPGRWKLRCDAFGGGPGGERSEIPAQTIEVVAGKTANARFDVP